MYNGTTNSGPGPVVHFKGDSKDGDDTAPLILSFMVIIILSQSSYHQVHDVRSQVQMGGRSQVRAGKSNIPLFLLKQFSSSHV